VNTNVIAQRVSDDRMGEEKQSASQGLGLVTALRSRSGEERAELRRVSSPLKEKRGGPMRRSLCACLLTVMALAGGAHADWYWSPRRAIVRGSDTDYTNSNNARCIVEQGGKLNAVLVRDTFPSGNPVKQVYYTNSTDWGEMGTLPIYAK